MIAPLETLTTPTGAIKIVTLAGPSHLKRDYVVRCMETWSKVVGAGSSIALLPGGPVDETNVVAEGLGLSVASSYDERIEDLVRDYPTLRNLRKRFVTWRKIVDANLLYGDAERLLFLDTDVALLRPVCFSNDAPDFLFQYDDVPAYRGALHLALREPILKSLNAGVMYYRPAMVALDHLEYLAARYFTNQKTMWWTVQAAWSMVIAASQSRAVFSGRDVRLFSGSSKRSLEELTSNRVRYWSANAPLHTIEEAMHVTQDAAIVHFAGGGKKWIIPVLDKVVKDDSSIQSIRWERSEPVGAIGKILISARMSAVAARDFFRI